MFEHLCGCRAVAVLGEVQCIKKTQLCNSHRQLSAIYREVSETTNERASAATSVKRFVATGSLMTDMSQMLAAICRQYTRCYYNNDNKIMVGNVAK